MDSSSTSSSEPRRPPKAALLALGLVLAGEAGIKAALPVNQGRHPADEVTALLDARPEPKPVVLWCDSVTAGAVEEEGGDDFVAKLGSTQAISMAGVYYTYLRQVREAGPPKVLVLSLIPESYGNDLDQVYNAAYFESLFMEPAEVLDFARTTGRLGIASRMAMNGLLLPPSMKRRAAARVALRSLRDRGGPTRAPIPLLRIAGTDPEVAASLGDRERLREFRMSPLAALYLGRIAGETARTGTRLVFMTGALPAAVARGWEGTGYLRSAGEWFAEFARSRPHVTVEPLTLFADYAPSEMYDRAHLKPGIAQAYGRRVVERLRAILDEVARGERR